MGSFGAPSVQYNQQQERSWNEMNSWYEPSGPGAMASTINSYGQAPPTSYSTHPNGGGQRTSTSYPGSFGSYSGGQSSTAYPPGTTGSYPSTQPSAPYYPSYGSVGAVPPSQQQSTPAPSADAQEEPSSRGLFADRLSAFSGVDKSKSKPTKVSRGVPPPVINLEPSHPPQQHSANGTKLTRRFFQDSSAPQKNITVLVFFMKNLVCRI